MKSHLSGGLVRCPACRGAGSTRHTTHCPRCLVNGRIEELIPESVEADCSVCGGSGRGLGAHGDPCASCGGRGSVEKTVIRRESHLCPSCLGSPSARTVECQ